MHTFKAAQPALLYLSPACIGSVILCALARGELAQLWAFDDASDDDKPKKDEREAVKSKEEVQEVAEGTSLEVEGQRVLRSRVVKQ
jgi:minor histocompatibility antigen H13